MKRTYGTEKVAELKIKIEQPHKDWLKQQAYAAGITMGEYVRRIVEKEMEKNA